MSEVYFRIQDANGNYVNQYAFQKENQGRKVKWWYFSTKGYISGQILYGCIENAQKIFDYLVRMNRLLHQSKSFKIVSMPKSDIKNDGISVAEELKVGDSL